jgi:hypothetical protein
MQPGAGPLGPDRAPWPRSGQHGRPSAPRSPTFTTAAPRSPASIAHHRRRESRSPPGQISYGEHEPLTSISHKGSVRTTPPHHFEEPRAEAEDSQDGDDAEDSLEGTSSTTSPPPAHLEDPSIDRKRKRVEELLSSSTSASKAAVREPSAPNDDIEIFDLLDS